VIATKCEAAVKMVLLALAATVATSGAAVAAPLDNMDWSWLADLQHLPKGHLYTARDGDSELILSEKNGRYKIEIVDGMYVSCEPISSTAKSQKEWPYLARLDANCHGAEHNKYDAVTHITWQVVDGDDLVMTWKYDDFPPAYAYVWKWKR
jgi:hypothetical protein